jgi:hypothetical protein
MIPYFPSESTASHVMSPVFTWFEVAFKWPERVRAFASRDKQSNMCSFGAHRDLARCNARGAHALRRSILTRCCKLART